MKRVYNNKNKMFLTKYNNSKKVVNTNNVLKTIKTIENLFTKKVSFSLTFRKFNKSYGTVYRIYYNPFTDLYGSNFEKQDTDRVSAIKSILSLFPKKEPDFFKVKTCKNLHKFNRLMNRKINCLRIKK